MDTLYSHIKYEFQYEKHKEKIFREIFKDILEISRHLRKAYCIVNHNSSELSSVGCHNEIKTISNEIINNFTQIKQLIITKTLCEALDTDFNYKDISGNILILEHYPVNIYFSNMIKTIEVQNKLYNFLLENMEIEKTLPVAM